MATAEIRPSLRSRGMILSFSGGPSRNRSRGSWVTGSSEDLGTWYAAMLRHARSSPGWAGRCELRHEKRCDMASPHAGRPLSYERVLQAIGRLAEKQRLRDLCILEVEGGVVLQGRALGSTSTGFNLVSRTRVLSHSDLEALVGEP